MFQFLKNDKSLKKDIRLIFLMAIIACLAMFLFSLVAGCASQSPKVEDSNHYRAQVQLQTYPCSSCGLLIPDKDVSTNIRMKNRCPYCGNVFFGKPKSKSRENEGKQAASSGLKSHGPRSIYESDVDYQYFWVGGESFKETETGYSFLYWRFRDSKVKSRRVIPHWTTRRYGY